MSYPTVELNSHYKMPVLGLGTWRSAPEDTYRIVKEAIKLGYRHIDTAEIYMNERDVGHAINDCIKEGIIKREDMFITTKLWFAFYKPGEVEKACRQSLKNLGLDYIDLFLIHNPFVWEFDEALRSKKNEEQRYNPTEMMEIPMSVTKGYDPAIVANVWSQMEDLVTKGLVHSIGVSNFTVTKLKELFKTAKIMPATNQIEINPDMQQPTVYKFCTEKGIPLTAYSNFGREIKLHPNVMVPLTNPVIAEIGKKYNKSNAQVILRWLLQKNILVIPKTVTSKRLRENFDVFDFELSEEDMKTMNGLNKNDRTWMCEFFITPGKTIEDIWDHEDI